MTNKRVLLLILLLFLLVIGVFTYSYLKEQRPETPLVSNFKECVAAGYPVMESYPRQCTANGLTFTEEIGNELEKIDLIRIENPRPNQVVASPLEISGVARGTWFFEADFPVYLYDEVGNEVASGIATTTEDWMTEEFVSFSANLTFEEPVTARGQLVLEKDNPSGLPEHDDALIVPVFFR